MEFYEKHPEMRSKYAVVTVHGPGAKTLAELAPHLTKLEAEVWKKPFPFPILFDSTESNLKTWGIIAYPTTVLIDPDGNVVKGEGLETLKAKLGVKG